MEYKLLNIDKPLKKPLKLTPLLRRKLKKPFGRLFKDIEDIKTEIDSQIIICVGDKVSEEALRAGIEPKIIVYDGKIMRRDVKIPDIIKNFEGREIRIKNPAGYITPEVFDVLDRILNSKPQFRFKIFIDGEEDLVSIAAINLAPVGSLVIYGQPNEGLVLVRVDKNRKERIEKIIRQMM